MIVCYQRLYCISVMNWKGISPDAITKVNQIHKQYAVSLCIDILTISNLYLCTRPMFTIIIIVINIACNFVGVCIGHFLTTVWRSCWVQYRLDLKQITKWNKAWNQRLRKICMQSKVCVFILIQQLCHGKIAI